jgi:eukaryotic-like serine/threonine-protein kinase
MLFFVGYAVAHYFFHPRGIIVPCVVGKTSHEAIKKLSESGLNIRFFTEKLRDDVEEGVVLEQTPRPGSFVRLDNNVFVSIAVHKVFGSAPTLVGKKYSDVLKILKNMQIRPKVFWLESSYPKNFCMSQFPVPDTMLRSGEVITYFSSGKNNKFIFPNLKGKPLPEVKAFLEKENMKVDIFAAKSTNDQSAVVLDQKPVAGSIIDGSRQIYVQLQVS